MTRESSDPVGVVTMEKLAADRLGEAHELLRLTPVSESAVKVIHSEEARELILSDLVLRELVRLCASHCRAAWLWASHGRAAWLPACCCCTWSGLIAYKLGAAILPTGVDACLGPVFA
jgi:hypothetical protein